MLIGWESAAAVGGGVLAVLAFYFSVSSHLIERAELLRLRVAALPADAPIAARRELAEERERLLNNLPAFRIGVDVLILSLFAAQVFIFGWIDFVALAVPEYLDVLPGLAPYFAMLAASWVGQYRIERQVRGNDWRPFKFVSFQSRANLMTIAPIIIIYAGYWAVLTFVPTAEDLLAAFYFLQAGVQVLLVLAASVFVPVVVRMVLPSAPMPDGRLRRRLETFARDRGIRVNQILVWRTGSRLFGTAFVIGLMPPFRYVFITDALLKRLDEDEILAVFAHELGHVRHKHLWWLLGFVISFTALMLAVQHALIGTSQTLQMAAFAAMLGYGYVLFGYISRRFERDADAYASDQTSPELIGQVFLKLGADNPAMMKKNGWRHFSLERRVREIVLQKARPEVRRIYKAELRRGLAVALAVALLALGLLAQPVRKDVVSGLATYSLNQFDSARVNDARPERLEELRKRTLERSRAMSELDDEYALHAYWYVGVVEGLSGRQSSALDDLQARLRERQESAETPEERAGWGREIKEVDAARAAIERARENGTRFEPEYEIELLRRGLK